MLKYYYEKQHDNILYTTTPNTTNIYSKIVKIQKVWSNKEVQRTHN